MQFSRGWRWFSVQLQTGSWFCCRRLRGPFARWHRFAMTAAPAGKKQTLEIDAATFAFPIPITRGLGAGWPAMLDFPGGGWPGLARVGIGRCLSVCRRGDGRGDLGSCFGCHVF